jgi:NADH-quinone oxidoreductase subunit L
VTFTVGALSLAGAPPLSIWLAKDDVLAGALASSPALYAVGLAGAALSAAYAARALVVVWGRPQPVPEAAREQDPGPVTLLMRAPLPVLAAAAAGLGALQPLLPSLLGSPAGPRPTAAEMAGSAVLALAVLALAGALALRGRDPYSRRMPATPAVDTSRSRVMSWLTVGRARSGAAGWLDGWLLDWLGLERLAVALVARPVVRLAGWAARLDQRVVDGGVRATAALAAAVSRLATVRVEVGVDGIVRAVSAGARRLGGLARRPQTGQLHHYYAQAVVLLALLALVFALVR